MLIPFVPNKKSSAAKKWLQAFELQMSEHQFKLLDELTDAEKKAAQVAIVANADAIDFNQMPNLKWIQSTWAGVENLLTNPTLGNVPVVRMQDPALATTMAHSVLCWVMNCQRHNPIYRQQQAQSLWQPHPVTANEDLNVVLLGAGNMAQHSAQLLSSFGYQVHCWARRSGQVVGDIYASSGRTSLRNLLGIADITILLLPLTDETKGLLNEETLSWMAPDSYLINFSRGKIIHDEALLKHLSCGAIRHAILDVFATEPLPPEHAYWHHPRVTVLPHISAPTNPFTASKVVAENITDYVEKGVIPVAVNRKLGY
ncbi:2-hydroxyacid dehydrogenase [Planctobacterium marinum]|uniref:2-hydroxyacid dehydrogenase n=1 Tax=Planctobacterium marinum TaxID=1631968 RepID=UPI001E4C45EC|nr:glyoxylate/hydroxypyruvate reductase A [Planctobacterium marinum]MCC2606671.1 glyoxylate/hydroxypyruvate reductase A [Planctobacterium marinum]